MSEDYKDFDELGNSQSADEGLVVPEIGIHEGLTDEHSLMIFHLALKERLEPLKTKGSRDPVEQKQLQKRNRLVMQLGGGVPRSESEANFLDEGASRRILAASRTKNGDPKVALKKTYEASIGFLNRSDDRFRVLDKALMSQKDIDDGPDPEVVRHLLKHDDEYRSLFEEFFFEKEALSEFNWRKDRASRRNYAKDLVKYMATAAYPSYLTDAHVAVYGSEAALYRAWWEQISEAEKLPVVAMLLTDKTYTPPSKGSRRHARLRQIQNEEAMAENSSTEEEHKGWREFRMPDHVKAHLVGKYVAKSNRAENNVQQGTGQVAAELSEFPGPAIHHEGQVVGYELPNEQPSAEKLVKSALEQQERRRRRFSRRR
ncbi:hypothetical protein KW792_00270 [Candidatus Saccharibacteria bacterium]|nr:hypothetical protein [Candidatus Saccharibacteria bacterium]